MTLSWGGGVCTPSLSSGGLVEVILGDLGCQVPGGSGLLLPGWKSCSRRLQGPGEGLTAEATPRHGNPATRRDLRLQGTWRVGTEPSLVPNACSQSPRSGEMGGAHLPTSRGRSGHLSSQQLQTGPRASRLCWRRRARCLHKTEAQPQEPQDAPPAGLSGRGHCSCLRADGAG